MAWGSMSVDGVRAPVKSMVNVGKEPISAFYLDNQVGGELTIGDVHSTNMESTSNWQVNLGGLELDGAAVGTTPKAIVDSGTRPSQTHHGREVYLCSSDTSGYDVLDLLCIYLICLVVRTLTFLFFFPWPRCGAFVSKIFQGHREFFHATNVWNLSCRLRVVFVDLTAGGLCPNVGSYSVE